MTTAGSMVSLRRKHGEDTVDFCDLDCIYAAFPKSDAVDGSRSCRTFVALDCKLRKTLVHKNLPCKDKRVAEQSAPGRKEKGAPKRSAPEKAAARAARKRA